MGKLEEHKKSGWKSKGAQHYVMQRAKALKKRRENLKKYAVVARVLEDHKWKFNKEEWPTILRDIRKDLHVDEEMAQSLLEVVIGMSLIQGNPNVLKMLGSEVVEQIRTGMYETAEQGDYFAHQGYVRMMARIVRMFPERGIEKSMIGMFQSGDTKGFIAQGSPAELIKAIKEAKDIKPEIKIEQIDG